jgi:glycosyltransferase involved in cell wall biosynthesis
MATYNGGAFIARQLNSLLAQTYTNWQLWIRDDGSMDKTLDIIKAYMERCSNIRLIINKSEVKGARSNFSALFDLARQDETVQYIMFCDQDDIWKADKIERSFFAIQDIETNFSGEPALIYGNLQLMGENDRFIAGELKLKHHIHLRNLISYNYVFGCTMMLNRALIDEIEIIPSTAENHDYWIALVASLHHSRFIQGKLICYRQHGQNTSGNIVGNNGFLSRIERHFLSPQKEISMLRSRYVMLTDFFSRYQQKMSPEYRQLLHDYLKAYDKGRLTVCYEITRNRIFRKGFFQSLALIYHILFFFNSIKAKTAI